MQPVIFSLLAIVILLGAIWYHDVRHPPEEQARERERNQQAITDGTGEQSQEHLVEVPIPKQ